MKAIVPMKATTTSGIGRYWLAERPNGDMAKAIAWCENTNERTSFRVGTRFPMSESGRMAVEANCILHAINHGLAKPEMFWAPWDEVGV